MKKKKKKHEKIVLLVLLRKLKLYTIEVLISKFLIGSYINILDNKFKTNKIINKFLLTGGNYARIAFKTARIYF